LEKAEIRYNVFAPRELCSDKILPFDGGPRKVFADLFNDFDAIIAVMAVGIVVRCTAPLITNKKTDPAVVVVDDLGKYAISLLSGHIRGANRLTNMIAGEIGAMPVITTATELLGKKSVEDIAEEYDLVIMNFESLTTVNSAIVNEDRLLVAVIGDMACPRIENADLKYISNTDQLKEIMKNYDVAIVLSPTMPPVEDLTKPVAILTTKRSPPVPERKSD